MAKNEESRIDSDTIWAAVVGLPLLALFGLAFYCLVQTIRSDGEVSYCYVQVSAPLIQTPVYQLYGFRSWRQDRQIGTYSTLEEATRHADDMKCPLNKK